MRRVALVSLVLFGCDQDGSDRPATFDEDLPARLDCTTSGYYADGGGNVTWRGSLVPEDGTLDLARGPLHVDAPFPGDVDHPVLNGEGTATWDDEFGTLTLVSEAVSFTLTRDQGIAGFVLSGAVDVGDPTALVDDALQMWCWNPEITSGFTYDERDGVCRDADGNEGTERRPIGLLRETGDGQCIDLTGVALDEQDYAYQAWSGFDLRGADMTGASLHFADIEDGLLQGAQMAGLDYGYAIITGDIDEHTTLPPEGCESESEALSCFR